MTEKIYVYITSEDMKRGLPSLVTGEVKNALR